MRRNLGISLLVLATVVLAIWFWGIHPAYEEYPGMPISEGLLTLLFFIAGALGVVMFQIAGRR